MKLFVVFLLLLHASQHALAVVVQAYEGEPSILLPFQFYDHFTIMPEEPLVSWIRNDLNPKIIHQLNNDGDDLKKQNKRYRGRTSMENNALDSGELSLTLRKPQISDSGNYACTMWTGYEELTLTEIHLQVKDNREVVEAQKEAESVRLPCKTSPPLPEDTRVEWTHHDPVKKLVQVVRVYQNKSDDLRTHTSWGHTEMDEDLLTTGDFSLTIKNPTDRDIGTYICTFYVNGDTMKHRVELQPEKVMIPIWAIIIIVIIIACLLIAIPIIVLSSIRCVIPLHQILLRSNTHDPTLTHTFHRKQTEKSFHTYIDSNLSSEMKIPAVVVPGC